MCIRMCCGPCRASWPLWLSSAIAGRHPPCSAVTLIGKDAAHDVVIRATRPEASVEGQASGKEWVAVEGWCSVQERAAVEGQASGKGWRCVKGQASGQGWTRVAAKGCRQTSTVGGATPRPSSCAAHPG